MNLRTIHNLGLPQNSSGIPSDAGFIGGDLTIKYVPDTAGRIAQQIVDPTGLNLVTRYTYDNNGNKLTEEDPRQHTTYFTYDVRNRLRYANYPDGSQKQFVYDPNGNKIQEWDENNHVTLFAYDSLNRLTAQGWDMNGNLQIDPGVDLVTSYTYNDVNSPVTMTDPNGNVTKNWYDALQRVYQVDHPVVGSTKYTYDLTKNCGGNVFDSSSFKPTQITDPALYVTNITYDSLYRVTKSSRQYQFGLGNQAIFADTNNVYDNVGNLTSKTDPRGHTTTFGYDALNRLYQVQAPDTGSTYTTYSSTGLKWQEQDECQKVTQIQYDGAGRATDVYAPAVYDTDSGQTVQPHTQTIYDENGNAAATINPRQYRWDYTFDSRNRRSDELDPAVFDAESGGTLRPHIHTEYDGVGNKISLTDARGNTTSYTPDIANRITQVTGPSVPVNGDATSSLQPATSTTYDLNGNIKTVTDANSHVTTNYYDGLNRLTFTVDPQLEATQYEYDALGNRTMVAAGYTATNLSAIQPDLAAGSNAQTTMMVYDGLNRMTSVTYPFGPPQTFTYDGVVKTSRTDGNGQTTQYDTYDGSNRIEHVTYPNSQDNRAYGYDPAGRILSVSEGHGGVTDVAYTYDDDGRIQTETSNGAMHTYSYDLAGNRTKTVYGTGRILLSSYDPLNRLETLADGSNTTTYAYNLNGSVCQKTLPDNERETTSYDALDRQSASSDNGGGGLLYSYGYGHDAVGNLTLMSEYKAGLNSRCVTMSYYDTDRLETETVYPGLAATGPPTSSTTYVYDDRSYAP